MNTRILFSHIFRWIEVESYLAPWWFGLMIPDEMEEDVVIDITYDFFMNNLNNCSWVLIPESIVMIGYCANKTNWYQITYNTICRKKIREIKYILDAHPNDYSWPVFDVLTPLKQMDVVICQHENGTLGLWCIIPLTYVVQVYWTVSVKKFW